MATYGGQIISTVGSSAMEIAPLTGPAAPFVAAGGAIVNMIGHLFGPPRTLPQTFQEKAYPYTVGEAKLKNLPVFVFWFGDIIVTFPDGSYGVSGHTDTLQAAYDYWDKLSQSDVFEVLACEHGIEDFDTGGCNYKEYGDINLLSSASIAAVTNKLTKNPLLLIGLLGGGLFLARKFL